MTQLVMMKPEHIRPNMDEQKNEEQTAWVCDPKPHPIVISQLTGQQRIEPYGWDRKDREYYALDDNRLYRFTAASVAPASSTRPKKNSQKARAAARAAKRRRTATAAVAADSTNDEAEDVSLPEEKPQEAAEQHEDEDPLGGATWECVAITLDELRIFIEPLKKSKDPNEKVLRTQIEEHMLPLLEKQEESRKRKMEKRERELLSLEKMAHAKRSSRIAGRAEQRKHEEVERQEREQRFAEEAAARKEEQKKIKMEKDRDHRMLSRDQRLREREARRILHEEELAQLSEGSKSTEPGRLSERRLKAEIEKNKQALKELEEEEEDWIFDCICGLHGQVDDGEHSVACERCNVWQHSKCLGLEEGEAEREDFHFICKHCNQAESEKTDKSLKPLTKIKLKLKDSLSTASTSTSPANKPVSTTPIPLPQLPGVSSNLFADIKSKPPPQLNGVSLPSTSASSSTQLPEPSPQKHGSPPTDSGNHNAVTSGAVLPSGSLRKPSLNGSLHNPFSSPHPHLLPPNQSPNKSRAYGSIYNSSSPVAENGLDAARGSCDRPPLSLATANAVSAGHDSPTKESATKNTPNSSTKVLDQLRSSPSSMATPRLSPTRPEDSDPLPSSRGGLSPRKHSPSLTRSASVSFGNGDAANGLHSSPAPSILPPVASLSPSPAKADLTPPVKVDSPPRPVSQRSTQLHSSPVLPKPPQAL